MNRKFIKKEHNFSYIFIICNFLYGQFSSSFFQCWEKINWINCFDLIRGNLPFKVLWFYGFFGVNLKWDGWGIAILRINWMAFINYSIFNSIKELIKHQKRFWFPDSSVDKPDKSIPFSPGIYQHNFCRHSNDHMSWRRSP